MHTPSLSAVLNERDGPHATAPQRQVLIVDDDPEIGRVLVRAFGGQGLAARCAQSVDEALDIILTDPAIHVVVADIHLPTSCGITLAEETRMRRDPRLAVEFIFITGGATAENAISALRVGAFEFFAKPLRLTALSAAVSRALGAAERCRASAGQRTGDASPGSPAPGFPAPGSPAPGPPISGPPISGPPISGPANAGPAAPAPADDTDHANGLQDATMLAATPDGFNDEMLLDWLLKLAPPGSRKVIGAAALLETFGGYAEVLAASPRALASRGGLTEQQAIHLKAVQASAVRLLRARVSRGAVMQDWDGLCAYLYASMADQAVETVRVLFLNAKNRLLADETLATGTIDFVSIHPREVVRRAIELGATSLIIAHNHPSGDPAPSASDIALTQAVIDACGLVGVSVLDHVIVGRGGVRSLSALGYLARPAKPSRSMREG